ncbi:MAG: DUF192 domain-containing protein [bacterium]|nr:DUF192 domain-containing protein [bacterium]
MRNLKLNVLVASTWFGRLKGLSFQKKLPGDGMLFVFEKPARTPFWMWGMRFPIDLIWIANGRVVGWEENLPFPKSMGSLFFPWFLKQYRPPESVDMVLEVTAGFCRREGVDIGDEIEFSPPL